ncbi:MAG: hypothetical protein HYZ90_06325 [Candidatus Omnitrophica bacterium]|nr:hypothetical protein [Candidatus Omnitrophota bacterium]
MRSLALAACLFLVTAGCALSPRPSHREIPPARLSREGNLIILRLEGTPYEMGYQHGSALPAEVRASVANAMAFVDREAGIRFLGGWFARVRLDQVWKQMSPFIPYNFLEELRGLSDGAGIPLKTLQRVHLLPELKGTTCSGFAAFGRATRDGRLIHLRNLDWAIQSDVQRYSALFVFRPKGKRVFVAPGWLGFIGVLSGISEEGISVGQIGSDTVDSTLRGVPMNFLLRQVLEESGSLEEAVRLVGGVSRTGGFHYLFSDSKRRQAVVLETTRSRCAVFWADEEPKGPFSLRVPNALFRSDWALDPEVRNLQIASQGDPKRPGLESPVGSKSYDIRYRGQGQMLQRFHGRLDPELAMDIAKAVAPPGNIQSVIFAYPQMWLANAQGKRPAAWGRYLRFDLEKLFR